MHNIMHSRKQRSARLQCCVDVSGGVQTGRDRRRIWGSCAGDHARRRAAEPKNGRASLNLTWTIIIDGGSENPGLQYERSILCCSCAFCKIRAGNERARAKAVHEFLFIRGIFWYFLQDQVREVRCNIYLASYLVSMKETSTPCPEMGLNGKEFSYTDFHIVLISMRILQAEPASLQKPKRVWY